MSEGLRGVIVGHGSVAEALVAAAEEISGVRGVLIPISNSGLDREALERRVVDAVAGMPAVVFVDLPSGSCMFAAMHRLKERTDVRIVTGVNLVMVLEFLFHRDRSAEEVARLAAESGAKGIGAR